MSRITDEVQTELLGGNMRILLALGALLFSSVAWGHSIAGTVVCEGDGSPMAGVEVQISDGTYSETVMTDEDGNYLQDALVRWRATGTVGVDGDEHTSTAGTWTNMLGRFRTIDVARIVAREGAALNPQKIEFAVEKQGYEMVRQLIRNRGRERMGRQQIDFVMRKTEQTQGADK